MKQVAKVTVLLVLGEFFLDSKELGPGLLNAGQGSSMRQANCSLSKIPRNRGVTHGWPLLGFYVKHLLGVRKVFMVTDHSHRARDREISCYHCTCDPGTS